jgi:ABC-type polysaccharide/polyol phosphate transport system ATPase subunit
MATRGGRGTPGVEFNHVWKKFHYGVAHDSLRDFIPSLARRMIGRGPRQTDLARDDFWALRDVSFRVAPGEALGIIGPNGSGKSTALKLLTRVLGPSRGDCRVTGRAGVLIELSSGFHPDLTGRENVFLQGTLMGMRRPEIARKFEQIVEFAGVARFIDTPVKRYSSGMSARLGFAIAAHLDPEVLIIDEVLAVGDVAFQRKALERVGEMVRSGIPVVIVTHQLEQVTALCTKAIVLEYGNVVAEGDPVACVSAYLERSIVRPTSGDAALVVKALEPWTPGAVPSGGALRMGMDVAVRDPARAPEHRLALRVRAVATGTVAYEAALDTGGAELPAASSWYWLDVALQLNVPPGPYYVEVVARERADGREIGSGPGMFVDVVGGQPFDGTVQMGMRCIVALAEEFPAERGHRAAGYVWRDPKA